jgi:polysaccharide deacetylase family protein (PEP-CTERM system associated)
MPARTRIAGLPEGIEMDQSLATQPSRAPVAMGAADARTEAPCVFSIDVEDWFHILALPEMPDIDRWDSLPSHVGKNFRAMLELFDSRNVHATCFFLGWVAERFPELVRAAADAGHEVASHGYSHTLVYEMTADRFLEDVRKSKRMIEDACGKSVLGYRAPGFSVTERTPWFFEKLAEAGYRYDSSIFPASRQHGGFVSWNRHPSTVETIHGPIVEFPITVSDVLGKPLCFYGGGYLRLAPFDLIRRMGRRVLKESRPLIFYVHPREIDVDHPRMQMSAVRRFKSYVNLATTRGKIERLLEEFSFTTFESLLPATQQSGAQ